MFHLHIQKRKSSEGKFANSADVCLKRNTKSWVAQRRQVGNHLTHFLIWEDRLQSQIRSCHIHKGTQQSSAVKLLASGCCCCCVKIHPWIFNIKTPCSLKKAANSLVASQAYQGFTDSTSCSCYYLVSNSGHCWMQRTRFLTVNWYGCSFSFMVLEAQEEILCLTARPQFVQEFIAPVQW